MGNGAPLEEFGAKPDYTPEPFLSASSRSPAFSPAGRGISMHTNPCSSVTDTTGPSGVRKRHAQTILHLHHDKRTKVRRLIHGHHRQPSPPRLAAQEQTRTRIHQALQPDLPRLLRTLLVS